MLGISYVPNDIMIEVSRDASASLVVNSKSKVREETVDRWWCGQVLSAQNEF